MEKIDDCRPLGIESLDVHDEIRGLKSKLNEIVDWINKQEAAKARVEKLRIPKDSDLVPSTPVGYLCDLIIENRKKLNEIIKKPKGEQPNGNT